VKAKIGDRTASNEEFVARLSKLPLHFNPGDRWEYSVAVDVQGRLLEVLNGGKPAPGFGFGLGFEVRTAVGEASQPGSVGEYGWSGAAGTTFWVDPKEQLYAIYMIQANDADTRDLRMQFRSMVQAALLD
jgi:hypothetical protein